MPLLSPQASAQAGFLPHVTWHEQGLAKKMSAPALADNLSYSLPLLLMTVTSAFVVIAYCAISRRGMTAKQVLNGVLWIMVGLISQLLSLVSALAFPVLQRAIEGLRSWCRNQERLRYLASVGGTAHQGDKQQRRPSADHGGNFKPEQSPFGADDDDDDIVQLPSIWSYPLPFEPSGVYPVEPSEVYGSNFSIMYDNDLSQLYPADDESGSSGVSSTASLKRCYPPASGQAVPGLGSRGRMVAASSAFTSKDDADHYESHASLSHRPSVRWRVKDTMKDRQRGSSVAEESRKKRFSQTWLGSSLSLIKSEFVTNLSAASAAAASKERRERRFHRPRTATPTSTPTRSSSPSASDSTSTSPPPRYNFPQNQATTARWSQGGGLFQSETQSQQQHQSPISPGSGSGSGSASDSRLHRLAHKSSKNALKETVSSKLKFLRHPNRPNRLSRTLHSD